MTSAMSPVRAALGLAVVVAMPVLLLRPLVHAFASGDAVVWLNPKHVLAGFGFAGLAVGFVASLSWTLALRRSLSEGSVAVAAILAGATLLGLVAKGIVVERVAHRAGYQRCSHHDRFQAGNIRRNDVTLEAWATSCVPASR